MQRRLRGWLRLVAHRLTAGADSKTPARGGRLGLSRAETIPLTCRDLGCFTPSEAERLATCPRPAWGAHGMAALLRTLRSGVVASPPIPSSYSAVRLPPTLPGCSGFVPLSATFHQPSSALRALNGLRSINRADLGHFRSTADTSLRLAIHFAVWYRYDPATLFYHGEVRVLWFHDLLNHEIPHPAAFRMPATWLDPPTSMHFARR